MFLFVLLLPLLFVGVPAALWFRSRDEARRRWLPRQQGTTRLGDDNYRGAEVPRMVASGPPPLVHVTAMMCWILGVAFIPGLAMSLIGLLAMGIGIVGLPGLIAAARLLRLGGPLLRGEPQAAQVAREVARFVRWLNYAVLGIAGTLGFAALWQHFARGRISGDLGGVMSVMALTAFYAVVSLVHARMLERSAAHIDEEQRRRAEGRGELTGVRLGVEPNASQVPESFEVLAAQADTDHARR